MQGGKGEDELTGGADADAFEFLTRAAALAREEQIYLQIAVNLYLGDDANAGWDVRADALSENPLADFQGTLAAQDVATHRVLFGKVTGLRIGDRVKPLIYHDRGYQAL